jgi:hypothetical protein
MNENKNKIESFKKTDTIYKNVSSVAMIGAVLYFVISILMNDTFNTNVIISLIVFAALGVLLLACGVLLGKKKRQLIEECYGPVSDEDKQAALALTERVSTINKVYYYYDGPNARAIDLAFPLKQIAAGNRVFVGTYEPIKALADEMREDKDKHADEDINGIIFELVALMENNLSEI